MRIAIHPLLWIFLVLIGKPAYSQNIEFKHLGIKDGLANATVMASVQDSKGFMWIGTSQGLHRYDSRELITYRNDPSDSTSVSNNFISSLFFDSNGILWVGTLVGLNKYNPVTDTFERLSIEGPYSSELSKRSIRCVTEDKNGNLWVGTKNGLYCIQFLNGTSVVRKYMYEGILSPSSIWINDLYTDVHGAIWTSTPNGIVRLDPTGSKAVYSVFELNQTSLLNKTSSSTRICGDKTGNIWVVSSRQGLNKFDVKTRKFQSVPGGSKIINKINGIFADQQGRPWVYTDEGIYSYDPETKSVNHYKYDPFNDKSLRNNTVTHLYQDREGNLWVSTYSGGISFSLGLTNPFIKLSLGIKSNPYDKIIGTSTGDVLLISERGGIHRLNKSTNQFSPFDLDRPKDWQASAVYAAKSGRLWVALASSTVLLYSNGSKGLIEIKRFEFAKDGRFALRPIIISMIEDSSEQLWLGTSDDGIYVFNWKTGETKHYNSSAESELILKQQRVDYLFEDSKKNTWIGYLNGADMIKNGSYKSKWFPTQKDINPDARGLITCIHEDKNMRIWISAFNDKMRVYDPITERMTSVKELDVLLNNNISNILSDTRGYLWFSNDTGLVRFHPDKKSIVQYYFSDGIPGSEVIHKSAYRSPDGEMYFATNTGAFRFKPDQIRINEQPPQVAITAFKLFNRRVEVGDETGLLNQEITETKHITLDHKKSIFSVDFAVLSFFKPDKNQYAYKLEGFDENWNYVKTPTATYTNLPAGNYKLLVKGANSDGTWSTTNTKLLITVLPPWWNTWWAWLIYLLLTTLFLYLIMRMFWLRSTFKREVQLQQDKLDFFSNISHEIRTHLTLINGPVEMLLNKRKEDKEIQNHLRLARNTSDRLLNLVGELMDFRKLESGMTPLQVNQLDVIPYLKNIHGSFHHFAEFKGIGSSFSATSDSVLLWFDPDQLQKVIYNLLMNAYKFTTEGGSVHLSLHENDKNVEIKVYDNGKGIAPEHLGKLFTNYFQVYDYGQQNTGYGLGLALANQIVKLHRGSITVKSRMQNDGTPGETEFIVALQKGYDHFQQDQLVAHKPSNPINITSNTIDPESMMNEENDGRNIILLVEDNEEVRRFTSEVLKESYQVVEVANGVEAWSWASEHIPDLIISDVMMEGMDGLELCKKIKQDNRTSHIPLILLTARATTSEQLEGIETGADAYITKPFSTQILQSSIRTIFRAREVMQLKYNQYISLGSQKIEVNNKDDQFLNRVIEYVEENMEDQALGIMEISRHIGMSKSALYRKLKAMTQMTINDFVTMVRLERASQLLNHKEFTVSEVASKVGFDSRKHFSKIFKQRFGKTPRDYSGRAINDAE